MADKQKYIPMENNQTPEQIAEAEAAKAVQVEEVRAKVISDFGFDEIDDAERIEKLVTKEVEHRQKLSEAIGQKIKYRTEAETLRTKTVPPSGQVPEDFEKKLDERLNVHFEKRELDSLEYPDEVKNEIQKLAKVQGISIKQALRDPYVVYKIEQHEKAEKTEEASISRTHKTGGGKKTYSWDNPPKVDLSTEEGQKEWDTWKAEMKKAGH